MMISQHFSLAELTVSQSADRAGISNDPDDMAIANLTVLCHGLEMIRSLVGLPIHISSGYRSPVVNKLVGGAVNSQHMSGSAADITCPQYGDPKNLMKAIMAAKLPFDQCILEYYQPPTWNAPARGWVHVSFVRSGERQQALIVDTQGTQVFA
jgi:hypothetical protein